MFFRIAGGFCLGLGLALTAGLIVLIPAIKNGLDTVSDPGGWYGPLEGIVRGSAIYVVGGAAVLLIGLIAGSSCAVVASRSKSAWPYFGFPVLAAPILFLGFFVQSAKQASLTESSQIGAKRNEDSKASFQAMEDSAERFRVETRARAVAMYGDPISGPSDLDQLTRLMGSLFFPGASLGTNYATRTDPPSVSWPVVTLKCPDSTTLEEAAAYYAGIGLLGADSISGANPVRPGDREPGKLYVRAAKPEDPDQRITVVFIAEGF